MTSDSSSHFRTAEKNAPGRKWLHQFKVPLVDLGDVENPAFRGVLSPAPEVGMKREGVDAVFLENAEDYYKKYQGFDYWRRLVKEALARIGTRDASLVVEFGCGFGNATLPMLDLLPNARVIATDISPNLLAILKRLLDARNLSSRCIPVAMDAQHDYLAADCADLVVGAAVLHHLVEPHLLIQRAAKILKPGAAAIFFEPFEAGNAVLRLICLLVAEEAARRKVSSPAIDWVKQVPGVLEPQIMRQVTLGWHDRNDKWAFPRSVLESIASEAGMELIIYPIHDNKNPFTRHFTHMLETYAGMKRADLPEWVWDVFERFDRNIFSPELLTDLLLEGCIIFRKPDQSIKTTKEPQTRFFAAR